MFCSKCGTEISDEAVVCVHCGNAIAQPETKPETPVVEDKVSIGFCILSFFIPLFGVIYWALKYKETPRKAKACGITAIVSWVLNIFFSVIISVVYAILMSALM